ncbi:Crp/Fnr family transcriptional regulator [Symbiopectobacterium purcellii]|uniref:Crp/Fnr family transcriptional regulator n=1 Tax=Symbiopectobacterium purcellii TaxID=2871826 RepID=UPI003F85F1DA
MRYREFVLSPYGVIKIKSLGYTVRWWNRVNSRRFVTPIANRLKNDYILCPDMRQRSIAGCYQNNVAWLYQGDDKVFGQFERGEWVALAAVFMEHGRFPMNIRALSAGQAMLIPRETLHQFCLQRATLALQLLGNLSQKLYATINQIDWLTSSSAG